MDTEVEARAPPPVTAAADLSAAVATEVTAEEAVTEVEVGVEVEHQGNAPLHVCIQRTLPL